MPSAPPTPSNVIVWTIGHGARSRVEFLRLLAQSQIEIIVDVRRWPTSKTPHFRREALAQWLPAAHLEYHWLGEALGGYRRGGYQEHMTTPLFRTGVAQLLALARGRRTCLMCLEISPVGCHRRFIAQHLASMGIGVRHIISAMEIRDTVEPRHRKGPRCSGRPRNMRLSP